MRVAAQSSRHVGRGGLALASAVRRLPEFWRTPLYRNSFYLIFNTGLTGLLGLVYWVAAARLYPTESVGLATALISSGGLLSFIASLGLGYGLIRFLPSVGSGSSALINSALTLGAGASVALALVFLVGLGLWSPALLLAREHPIFLLSFVAFICAATLSQLLGQTFLGFRRAHFTVVMGFTFNLGRLLAVVILAAMFQVFGIFASWGLGMAVALGLGLFLLLPRACPGYRPRPCLSRRLTNEVVHFSFANYAAEGLWAAPAWLLPIVVVNLLGAEANAYFYMSWAVASLLFAIPSAISMSLFAEGSHQEDRLASDLRGGLRLMVLLVLPAMAGLFLAGERVLLLFGGQYPKAGIGLLLVLVASTLPLGLNVLYLGAARVRRRMKDIILVASSVAIGTLALSYILLPSLGILGTGLAWLVSHLGVAIVLSPRWKAVVKGTIQRAAPLLEAVDTGGG